MRMKLLYDEMLFEFCVKQLLVVLCNESTAAAKNENLVRVVLEHRHYCSPEIFKVFLLAVLAEMI